MEDLRPQFDIKPKKDINTQSQILYFNIKRYIRMISPIIFGYLILFRTEKIMGFVFGKISEIYTLFMKYNVVPVDFLTGLIYVLMMVFVARFIYLLPNILKRNK